MLSETMWKGLNDQIKWELESAYLYLGMAAWFADQKLPGFAAWMRKQSGEEMGHAMKIYDYIEQHGNRVELLPVAPPAKAWAGVQEAMETSLAHERTVTGLINALVATAAAERDPATSVFLNWFVSEQVEEENSFRAILDKLSFVKPGCSAMLFLDHEMGKRE